MYRVSSERQNDGIMLDVSRVLSVGRMSPIVGRHTFSIQDEPVLAQVLGTQGQARTELIDRIIRGGSLTLTEFLQMA
jgi:hypothetical protein